MKPLQKHTSDFLEDFQFNLSNRKKQLYEALENLSSDNDAESIIIEFANSEIERINKILKTIKKL